MVHTRAQARLLPPATPIRAPWAPSVPEGGLRVLLDTPGPNQELNEVDSYNQSAIAINRRRASSALSKTDEKALRKGQMGPPSLNPKKIPRHGLLFLEKEGGSKLEKNRMLFGIRCSFSLDPEKDTALFKDLPKSDESEEENEEPVEPFVIERGHSRTRVVQEANQGAKRTGTRPDPPLFAGSNAEAEARGNFRDITPPLKVSKPRKPLLDNTKLPAMRSASTPLPPRTQSTIDKMDYIIAVEMGNDLPIPPTPQPGSPVVALLSSSFSQVAISPLPNRSQTVIDYEYRNSSTPIHTKKGDKRGRDEEESPQKPVYKKTKMVVDYSEDTEMNEGSETEENLGPSFDPRVSMKL